MRAMVLEKFGEPLVLRNVPIPSINPSEVLLKITACGICGTDLKIQAGKWKTVGLPLIPGHEPVGQVAQVGSEVNNVKPGDMVLGYLYMTCGRCENCLARRTTICLERIVRLGFETDGGLAEYMKAPAVNVVKVPEGMKSELAAIIPDAVATPVHALKRADVQPGRWLLIMGVGGLGVHTIQIAKHLDLRVIACDVVDERIELARNVGADYVLDARVDDVPAKCRELTAGYGVHRALDMTGTPKASEEAAKSLRMGGRLVVVGYQPGQAISIDSYDIAMKEIDVVGSRAASLDDVAEALRLVESGAVKPVVGELFRLEEANLALERLRGGKIRGRAVVVV